MSMADIQLRLLDAVAAAKSTLWDRSVEQPCPSRNGGITSAGNTADAAKSMKGALQQ
jgi:hypothetical protein